jgi:hypothetical protein
MGAVKTVAGLLLHPQLPQYHYCRLIVVNLQGPNRTTQLLQLSQKIMINSICSVEGISSRQIGTANRKS